MVLVMQRFTWDRRLNGLFLLGDAQVLNRIC